MNKMINVLILCSDNLTVKNLVNNVISKIPDLRLNGIANTLEEGSYFVNKYEPILVISTNCELLECLRDTHYTYKPGIILIAKSSEDFKRNYRFKEMFLNIKTEDNYKLIFDKILNFMAKNYVALKKENIKEFLITLGFDFKLSGPSFLVDCIIYIINYRDSKTFESLTNDIYPYVAKKNKTNPQIIKWSIERSINYLYNKPETFEVVEKYLGIKYPEKLTPKTLITLIISLFED